MSLAPYLSLHSPQIMKIRSITQPIPKTPAVQSQISPVPIFPT